MNMTELWFLRNILDADEETLLTLGKLTVRTAKFGYEECRVEIGDQGYLVKHKTWISGIKPKNNIVFHVQKYKS